VGVGAEGRRRSSLSTLPLKHSTFLSRRFAVVAALSLSFSLSFSFSPSRGSFASAPAAKKQEGGRIARDGVGEGGD